MRPLPLALAVAAIWPPSPQVRPAEDEPVITEISLERSPCFGSCPVDLTILHGDGQADYYGYENVARKGHYRGRISKDDFRRLAELLRSRGFFDLDGRYNGSVTCAQTVITRAVRGGSTKAVENYAEAGPVELWGIERTIRGLASEVEWKKQK